MNTNSKEKVGWTLADNWLGNFPEKKLVTFDICLGIGRATFSSSFARDDWFISFNLFFTRWSTSCEYVMVFLRSNIWSLNSGRASSKHSVNSETCGETEIVSDLISSLYMDCNSAATKENFSCVLHCSFTKSIIFRKCDSWKKFSDGLSDVAVSCFIAAEYLLLNHIKQFLW